MVEPPEPTRLSEPFWLEPYPDVLLDGIGDVSLGPEARYEAAESIGARVRGRAPAPAAAPAMRARAARRARLPHRRGRRHPRQHEARSKGRSSERARRSGERLPDAPPRARPARVDRELEVVARFATAVEAGDIDGVVALLADDAWLTMPPEPYEYQGQAAIATFLDDREPRRGATLRARAHPRQRSARVRLLPPRRAQATGRTCLRG